MPAVPIPRIDMPTSQQFFESYVAKQLPVIVTNLFRGQPITEIDSLEKARTRFGDTKLTVRREYVSASASSDFTSREMSFNDFWDLVNMKAEDKYVCSEYDIPANIMASFRLPEVCNDLGNSMPEVLSFPRKYGDHDLVLNLFMAGPQTKSHLHYDGDQRQVLLYQVFGVKEVILFHPRSGYKLRPLDGPLLPTSGIYFDRMPQDERSAFLDEAEAYVGTLYPGDAIYMPSLFWHHFDYLTHAMSFNIRFGRNPFGRFLCVDNFHRDNYLQTFGSKLGGKVDLIPISFRGGFQELISSYLAPSENLLEKVKLVRSTASKLCLEFCPDAHSEHYCTPERENEALAKILIDIGEKAIYSDPELIMQSRPVGMATLSQRQQIEIKSTKYGYTPELLSTLLNNRLGKHGLERLTRVEAAVFLTYMRSPGACIA